jgi:hypothetical protein
MGLIGKSRRLKNGNVVVKMYPGNPAQTNCGEIKMGMKIYEVQERIIDEATGHVDHVATVSSQGLTSLQVCNAQDQLDAGYVQPMRKIARGLAESKEAAAA